MLKLARTPAAALMTALLVLGAGAVARSDDSNRAKARALVDSAIKLEDSNQAVKLLWQATEIDPTYDDAYQYLGLYYNSRQDFAKVADVYKQLVKFQPKEVSGYLNIGEAYMSFDPPRYDDALVYYRKAYEIDPHSSFAALRIGEVLGHQGNRDEARRYLQQAMADGAKNPQIAAQAQKLLHQIDAM